MHIYCHVFQWLRRGFELVNRFIGSSLAVTTISSYTFKITATIAHTKSSNSSSGHTAVPLELRNSSEVNSHSRILSYPLGTDHAKKIQFYCCVAQTTQKTSHVITISPVHWLADCDLGTSYKHLFYCCVILSEKVFIAPLPSYTRYNMYIRRATFIICMQVCITMTNWYRYESGTLTYAYSVISWLHKIVLVCSKLLITGLLYMIEIVERFKWLLGGENTYMNNDRKYVMQTKAIWFKSGWYYSQNLIRSVTEI
jgi:hypothetical protein